jgi:hypothetical protein
MDEVGFKTKPSFLVTSITDYAAPEAGFSIVYLEDVSILLMDEVGFKTQPEVSGEVHSSLYLYLWLSSVLYRMYPKNYPSSVWTRRDSRLTPRLLARSIPEYAVQYLRMASALYIWRTYTSSV